MKDFYEKEHKMINIFTGMFFTTFIFYKVFSSFGSGSFTDTLISLFYSGIFFVILFVICAIVFGEHYP